MQYLLLIYEDESRFVKGLDPAEMEAYGAFGQNHGPLIKGGNALQPTNTAKTVRVRSNGTVSTDGPFAETKEQLCGYYLVDASTMDEAVSMAAQIPGARYGSVEVRPIMVFS